MGWGPAGVGVTAQGRFACWRPEQALTPGCPQGGWAAAAGTGPRETGPVCPGGAGGLDALSPAVRPHRGTPPASGIWGREKVMKAWPLLGPTGQRPACTWQACPAAQPSLCGT